MEKQFKKREREGERTEAG